jgi:hypothetical protein
MAKRRPKYSATEQEQRRGELTAIIVQELTDLAPQAIKTLKKIATTKPTKKARELMFEAFDVGPELNMVYRILGENGFLEQLKYGKVFDDYLSTVGAFDERDMSITIEWQLVRAELFRLFPQWWLEAGGASYPLPVTLQEHDSVEQHELAWSGT